MRKLLILFFLINHTIGYTQNPEKVWEKHYGGTGGDYANDAIATEDGGCLIVGTTLSTDGDITESYGYKDVWAVKVNASGDIEWSKTFGTEGNDAAYSTILANDGGYIVVGEIARAKGRLNVGSKNLLVLKLSPKGQIQWHKKLGGDDGEYIGLDVISTNKKDGYIIVGYTDDGSIDSFEGMYLGGKEVMIAKVDNNGEKNWMRAYGGNYNEIAYQVSPSHNNGYILTGFSESRNEKEGDVKGVVSNEDGWIFEFDESGEILWQKTLGGNGKEFLYTINKNERGYIVSGKNDYKDKKAGIINRKGSDDLWVVQIDKQGNVIEQNNFGGNADDFPNDAKLLDDESLLIGGVTRSEANKYDIKGEVNQNSGTYWLVNIKNNTLQWQYPVLSPSIGRKGKGGGVFKGSSPTIASNNYKEIFLVGQANYLHNQNKETNKKQVKEKKGLFDKAWGATIESEDESSYDFWITKIKLN